MVGLTDNIYLGRDFLCFLAGFGLGALNEADEDDLDVYDRGFDSGTHRVAFEEEADDQQYTIGSRNKNKPGVKPVRC